jgi:alpha-beta hydrolase superfamily lysophospholipase
MTRNLAALAALIAFVSLGSARAQDPAPGPDPDLSGPQDATVAVDGGDDTLLYGSLLRPENLATYPAVLILPAQGVDRNGNEVGRTDGPNTDRLLARDLVAKGIASLRVDKRGVGASEKAVAHEEDLRFQTFVDDAVIWAKFLQLQPHVNCVAILGQAEQALAAAMAAGQIKVCAVIEMSGSARTAAAVLAEQLKTAADAGRMDKDVHAQASAILDSLANGKTVANPPPALGPLFRVSVQPYLISWLDLDPLKPLQGATPVLVLQGASDLQLHPDDGQRLAAAARSGTLVMIPGADHDLKIAPKDPAQIAAADRPLAPQASAAIAVFLKRLHAP